MDMDITSEAIKSTFPPNHTRESLRRLGIRLRGSAWKHRPNRDFQEQKYPPGEAKMELSAPTKIIFFLSIILAILSLLPLLGIAIPVIGAYSYWLLGAGFVVLVAGNLVTGL
jgi:hypothetical protein